jgi:uncharacterized protein YcbK (DUF882 family)
MATNETRRNDLAHCTYHGVPSHEFWVRRHRSPCLSAVFFLSVLLFLVGSTTFAVSDVKGGKATASQEMGDLPRHGTLDATIGAADKEKPEDPTLALLGVVFFPGTSPRPALAAVAAREPVYELRLYHTHTNERLDIVYRRGDQYDPEALRRLELFLRDHRTGQVHPYDPRVFDLLHDLTVSLDQPDAEIDVVCGYRTPWSNNFLRRRSSAVAKHSLHMQAKAIDIRIPGVSTSQLRDAALSLHHGGVGYYRRDQFVHVDVGRLRRW